VDEKLQTNEKAKKDPNKGIETFDWVTARSQCSLPKVFYTLRTQVEQDVKQRNSLRPETAPYEFKVTEDIDNFRVLLESESVSDSVTFSLNEHSIIVSDGNRNQILELTVIFGNDGKCKLYADAEEREFWQVRRTALEGLMFRA
jgi:hypothetical protein